MSSSIVKKALSVATGGNLADWLPEPLANDVIAYIRDINQLRNLVSIFNMTDRTMKRPKKSSGLSAYHIPDGATGTTTEFTTTYVEFVAKKLMAYTMIDEEAVEDTKTLPNIIDMILKDFAEAIAYAEELVMTAGDPTHTATATTPDVATSSNWYLRDPRVMFYGLFTYSDTSINTSAADEVDGGSAAIEMELFNKAIYNLGKYGRIKANLAALVPSAQATNIRGNSKFYDATAAGIQMASFLSGLGGAAEGTGKAKGVVTSAYGIPVYEVPHAPSSEAVVYYKPSPALGDRRMIKIKSDEVIESDQRKYVVSERISFNYLYEDALCKIDDLSTDIVT